MRIGIYGGTFDPPHIAHLIVAQDALRALQLDHILFVPSAQPPHKQDRSVTPAEVRLALVRAAIAGDARFEVSDIEVRRPGLSFTVDTLRELRANRPADKFVLLLGADQYAEMDSWRDPGEIRRLAELAVMDRDGTGAVPRDGVQRVLVTRIDLSSSAIRELCAEGESIQYLVPDRVRAEIKRRGLYAHPD